MNIVHGHDALDLMLKITMLCCDDNSEKRSGTPRKKSHIS